MSNSNNNGRLRSWQTKESRHYCAICNVWMGNDRQSILLHENGKKHKEKVEATLKEKRDGKAAADKQAAQLQANLKAMEAAALQSMATGHDSLHYDTTATLASRGAGTVTSTTFVPAPPVQPQAPKQQQPSKKKEMKEWNARKKQRQDEKQGAKDGDDDHNNNQSTSRSKKRTIAPDQGHYTLDMETDDNDNNDNDNATTPDEQQQQQQKNKKTYLEATTFAEILEEEMPIQIWLGSHLASMEEKRLRHNQSLWINGLVVSVKRRKQNDNSNSNDDEDRMVVDVVYLKNPTDEDETMEPNVRLPRIRIVLGADESIPETVEEARILALGGEEVQVNDNNNQSTVDEATGLTSWSTVTIKRTTVHQQAREERARERQLQRLAKRKAAEAKQEAETRKMEESKVQNAEDSALGAYDVWGKGGYKGVDIHKEAMVSVQDTAKKLAGAGEKVAFKKTKKDKAKFKMGGVKKRNRRTTSADDD